MTTTGKRPRIPSTRLAADNATVLQELGLLADLSGTWAGTGFNLIARPDFHDNANLYLQLSQTHETLTIDPIGSPIPNRGFGQDDIEMFGLSYLQKVSDIATGGAMHLEPGLWVTQPPTAYPAETAEPGEQLIFRMGSIPHGNALLAQGTATAFAGTPVLPDGTVPYAFSAFPSFNSTPFPAGGPVNAKGTSELDNAPGGGFTQYTISNPASLANPRTPFDTDPADPPLPADINGVAMQTVVNDPATLLQQVIRQQVARGDTFTGVALNIATQQQVTFLNAPNDPRGAQGTKSVAVAGAGGGIENIPFLDGGIPTGTQGPNAQTALVYATFWIEQVTPPGRRPYMQLQYAQVTILDFPIFAALHPAPGAPVPPGAPAGPTVINLGWPHVSVATLRKTFN
jgi:hypothetical protein